MAKQTTKTRTPANKPPSKTGKCKKAMQSLTSMRGLIKATEERLDKARDVLKGVAHVADDKIKATTKRLTLKGADIPCEAVEIYIDFVLTFDEEDVEGAIVYGVLREPPYPHSLCPNNSNEKEERPLASLSVDDQGKVTMKGKLADDWWLTGEDDDVRAAVEEMHKRTLDLIWRDALNWVNEPRLP